MFSSAPYPRTFLAYVPPEVNDQVSHPYKTGKIVVLCILIFMLFDSKQGDKRFCAG